MKDPKKVRWVTLLAALVLLYGGIDSIFFDRVVGGDPLARIERTLEIVLGTLLITVSIGLFVVAWTGRPLTAMDTSSAIVRKLFADAYCAAVGAFVFALFLVRMIKHFDSRYVTGVVLSGAFLISVLFWTRRAVRRLAASETAKKLADQFLWSCIFLSMLSFGLGMAVTGVMLYKADFIRTVSAVWFGALTSIGIYPVLRDAKRLADATSPSQIPTS